jgi:ribosomal protein S18 acetylase RimI-like enzyme
MSTDYKIIPFCENFLEDIAKSFVESFEDWNIHEAKAYLTQTYELYPEVCLAAVNRHGECLGAIICKESPYQNGKMLVITSLQVKMGYRNQGIGKNLLKKVMETAKEKKAIFIGMSVSIRTPFPFSWYERIGLRQTGWVEVAAEIEEVKLKKESI